jgi:hypothetical protein
MTTHPMPAPLLIASVLVLFPLCCAQAEERQVEDLPDGTAFSYAVPSGWKVIDKPNQKFKVVLNETNAVNGLAPNIMIKQGQFAGKLEEFAEQTKAGFKKAYPAFSELTTDELKTDAGASCVRVVANNEIGGHKVRQNFYIFAGVNDLKLALTCTVPLDGAERYDGSLEMAAKSFRFERGTVESAVLNKQFDGMMKQLVDRLKTSGELGKDPSDETIAKKALEPVVKGMKDDHYFEVSKQLEKSFAAGEFQDESNQKILSDLCSFVEGFRQEPAPAAKYIMAENKAGHFKGAQLEVAIRIMKWNLNRLKETLQKNQQTTNVPPPAPPSPKP